MLTLVIGAPRVLLTEPAGSFVRGYAPGIHTQYTASLPEPAVRAALTLPSLFASVRTTRVSGRLTVRSRGLGILCLHPRQVSQEQAGHVRPIHTATCPSKKVGAEVKSRHLGLWREVIPKEACEYPAGCVHRVSVRMKPARFAYRMACECQPIHSRSTENGRPSKICETPRDLHRCRVEAAALRHLVVGQARRPVRGSSCNAPGDEARRSGARRKESA